MHTMSDSELSRSLHRAVEQCDIDSLISLYDDDAELIAIDRNHPPSMPMHLMGKQSIADHMRQVCSRPLIHHIEDELLGDDHLAYTESCTYPDGSRVFTSVMAELRDGKIVREVDVAAWDETPVI